MELNPEDRFRDSCSRYVQYPKNLLQTRQAKRKIQEWYNKLNDSEEKERLFDAYDPSLSLYDVYDGEGSK
jgi:hypothetical protein